MRHFRFPHPLVSRPENSHHEFSGGSAGLCDTDFIRLAETLLIR